MMHRILVVFTLVYTMNLVSSYMILRGNLAESTGMPVTLHCSQTMGYVLVGGITVNNKLMDTKLQDKVKKQCEKQMEKYKNGNKPQVEGTSCVLSLPRKDVSDKDIVRVVYSCHDNKPIGDEVWGEDADVKKKPIVEKKVSIEEHTESVLTCIKANEMINVETIKLNGIVANVEQHPDLNPETMTSFCYEQWSDDLQNGKGKAYHPLCTVRNDYGSDLEITYHCLGPGDQRKQMGKKMNSGNGNGNNGNENGNNVNGNGNNDNGNGNNGNGNGNNGNGNGNNGNGNGNNGNGNGNNGNGNGNRGNILEEHF